MSIQEFEMNCANVLYWNHVTSSIPKLPHKACAHDNFFRIQLYHTYWMSYNCLKLEVPLELWVNVINICVGQNSSTFGLRLYEEQPSTMVSWHHLTKNMFWIWKRKTKASSNSCNKCQKLVSKNLAHLAYK